ncbi:MAG: agmatine deiminase family protein [Bacteroidetes bacterium]|nr:agmatine deiminase family protein [Bacteroidota bacterium]
MKIKLLLASFIVLLISNQMIGQTKPDYRKLHYLSEEEMLTTFDPLRDFYPTDPPDGDIRNVAEFDQMQGVLVRYPFGIPVELIREMAEDITVTTIVANASQQQTVTTTYQNNNVNLDNCNFLIAPTDSYWVRDYGPWFVFDGNNQPGIVNFPYNRPRPNDNDIPIRVAEFLDIDLYGMNLISTGGNYMCDGMGIAASTDLVWDENPTLTHDEVAGFIVDYTGNSTYHVTDDPLDEYIKHIDCWAKYLTPGKVLVGQVPITDYRYPDFEAAANYFATQTSSYGKPYQVYRVFTPGTYPYTPYTNSLILNRKVLVPLTGSQWDDEAITSYQEAMPGYEIIGIVYNGWQNTDALHCRAKGIADIGMLYIHHIPTSGTVAYRPTYEITATITACSGSNIYADSVFVYYKINNGSYTSALMQIDTANNYTGLIENVWPGDSVSYYIYAADESGRNATCPFIGEFDPFVFTNIYFPVPEITFNPDTVLFLTQEDMITGIPLHIINLMSYNTTINSITEYGDEFMWYVEEMPDLPFSLGGYDTLTLNVLCAIPTNKFSELIIDTLEVETAFDTYYEPIAILSDLVNTEAIGLNDDIHIYPNPFTRQINFFVRNSESSEATIQIFDINGKKIIDISEQINGNGENLININIEEGMTDLKSGYYFYKIKTGNFTKSGKIIRVE